MNDVIEEIHQSLINGQRKQMVKQIDEYGVLFWQDYKYWLPDYEMSCGYQLMYFQDAVISYFRIKAKTNIGSFLD